MCVGEAFTTLFDLFTFWMISIIVDGSEAFFSYEWWKQGYIDFFELFFGSSLDGFRGKKLVFRQLKACEGFKKGKWLIFEGVQENFEEKMDEIVWKIIRVRKSDKNIEKNTWRIWMKGRKVKLTKLNKFQKKFASRLKF